MSELRILTMPGMGDIHWCVLKMKALMQREGVDKLHVSVWNADGKPRSLEYLKRVPFIDSCDYYNQTWSNHFDTWKRCTKEAGNDLQTGVADYDYVMGFNGSLERGRSIEYDILPDLAVDYSYTVTETQADAEYGEAALSTFGPYNIFYFNDLGTYASRWLPHFTEDDIVKTVNNIHVLMPDHSAVFVGLSWDVALTARIMEKLGQPEWAYDITLKTETGELFALMRRATCFTGWCAGNGIMAQHFGTPTVMLWSDHFKSRDFATCWADPKKTNKTYRPLFVEDVDPGDVVNAAMEAINAPAD